MYLLFLIICDLSGKHLAVTAEDKEGRNGAAPSRRLSSKKSARASQDRDSSNCQQNVEFSLAAAATPTSPRDDGLAGATATIAADSSTRDTATCRQQSTPWTTASYSLDMFIGLSIG